MNIVQTLQQMLTSWFNVNKLTCIVSLMKGGLLTLEKRIKSLPTTQLLMHETASMSVRLFICS